ncbi:MAG TPA: hypothetical protein VIY08_15605 [Candidatus Nitrosocosmicus sp.]
MSTVSCHILVKVEMGLDNEMVSQPYLCLPICKAFIIEAGSEGLVLISVL